MHFYEGTDMQLLIHSCCYRASDEGSGNAGFTDKEVPIQTYCQFQRYFADT